MTRFCLIGPTYPFRGGIAHHTTLLAKALRVNHDTLFISFTRQYPQWLFPGKNDRDPSKQPLQTEVQYLLDPLNPLTWRQTVKVAREWRADSMILPWWIPYWTPAWSYIGRRFKQQDGNQKLLFICHNVLPHENSLIDRIALRKTLSPGDGYIVHADSDRKRLLAEFPNALVKLSLLPTFADIGQGNSGNIPANLPSDRPLILFFGFVRPYKGLDILLKAMPLVLEKRPVHLLVAGEFWEKEDTYKQQIESLHIEESVTIINEYLSNEDLAASLARADVVVLPYRSATQSGVIQIAFGHGCPVITTDVGGLPDVVKDGQNGLVVPPEDPFALAAAITKFFDDDTGAEMVKRIESDRELYSWQRLVHDLEELAAPPP